MDQQYTANNQDVVVGELHGSSNTAGHDRKWNPVQLETEAATICQRLFFFSQTRMNFSVALDWGPS